MAKKPMKGKMMPAFMEKKDASLDKKRGIKENSKKDAAMDAKFMKSAKTKKR